MDGLQKYEMLGMNKTIKEWCDFAAESGYTVDNDTVNRRLRAGWPLKKAVFTDTILYGNKRTDEKDYIKSQWRRVPRPKKKKVLMFIHATSHSGYYKWCEVIV